MEPGLTLWGTEVDEDKLSEGREWDTKRGISPIGDCGKSGVLLILSSQAFL